MAVEEREKELANEEGVHAALEEMRKFLCEGEKANFREFWRARKRCIELFKGNMHPLRRSYLWEEYTKLLKEAHRLQKIFDEETEFEREQMLLAIEGLEKEFDEREKRVAASPLLPLQGLKRKKEISHIQSLIGYLKGLKEKIFALRKEVIDFEMRISQKNKLLEEIQRIGNKVFPEAHALLERVGELVHEEVKGSVEASLDQNTIKGIQEDLKYCEMSKDYYRKIRKMLEKGWSAAEQKREVKKRSQVREEEILDKRQKELFTINDKKQFQEEQKEFLALLRKEIAGAGLDIQRSLYLQELLNQWKENRFEDRDLWRKL